MESIDDKDNEIIYTSKTSIKDANLRNIKITNIFMQCFDCINISDEIYRDIYGLVEEIVHIKHMNYMKLGNNYIYIRMHSFFNIYSINFDLGDKIIITYSIKNNINSNDLLRTSIEISTLDYFFETINIIFKNTLKSNTLKSNK